MKRNWTGWVVGFIWVGTLGFVVYLYIQTVAALRSGQSRVAALEETQQRFVHVLANPRFFAAYLALLVALLFHTARKIYRKTGATKDFWVLAAVLAAIVTLMRSFLRSY
jgi:hypothetical protein